MQMCRCHLPGYSTIVAARNSDNEAIMELMGSTNEMRTKKSRKNGRGRTGGDQSGNPCGISQGWADLPGDRDADNGTSAEAGRLQEDVSAGCC
jgi:hypothetical protein